ncbi:class I SAM-dependent methyltransferase [Nocardia pseudovaccinii]|uniref:class I SAM-dependent methyltransferase n=1 Tax=Nocardia pseudovaccinii TaxID=189540 RepID=UPI0007A40429|nr:class I SAM-dependent methyltransferase [Nocardia pseudovaccinii]
MALNRDADASRLAAESLAQDDPTGWFERLYAEAAAGAAIVPWDRDQPNPMVVDWAERRAAGGAGRRALVVGCGYGQDAEYIARLGFATTAFDISPTAIAEVRQRFPKSSVEYVVADLLDLPAAWRDAFDLVVESITVQSMPVSVRGTAIANIRRAVAPGGQLIVIAGIRAEGVEISGPPWPLTRSEIDSFAAEGLRAIDIEANHETQRWRAEFTRSAGG